MPEEYTYNRIVSLVPSLTQLVLDLGAEKRLKGRTRFCIHPEDKVNDIPIIGGTKNPGIDKILELEPDLIIANREENRKEDIEALEDHCEILLTDIDTIEGALQAISEIGNKLQCSEQAAALSAEIRELSEDAPEAPGIRTAYFIWKDPWMSVGHDTYIHDVMRHYGLINVFGDRSRYPETGAGELSELQPELILLSSEPYPFKEKHIAEIQKICPESRIELINGEWFSWYGSGMKVSFSELNSWRRQLLAEYGK